MFVCTNIPSDLQNQKRFFFLLIIDDESKGKTTKGIGF